MVCKFELRIGDVCNGLIESSAKAPKDSAKAQVCLKGSRPPQFLFLTTALHELYHKEFGLNDRNTEPHEAP